VRREYSCEFTNGLLRPWEVPDAEIADNCVERLVREWKVFRIALLEVKTGILRCSYRDHARGQINADDY
jgi:hypothetical protein